jgi:proteasome lid subunit RPN8/RPN11
MPRKTWQVNYRFISKDSCVTILGEVRGELPETVCAFTLGGRSGSPEARNPEQNHRTDRCYDEGTDHAAAEQDCSQQEPRRDRHD